MKYQQGLEKTKKFLREASEPEIKQICNQAGLTDKEEAIIISKFRKSRPRLHASYDLGMSESRYSVKLTLALKIIKKVLISTGFIDE